MEHAEDEGTIEALLERLTKFTLPKALALRDKVNRGEKLSDFDIQFLLEIFERGKKSREMLHQHAEYELLTVELMSLYTDIIEKGMDNEHNSIDHLPRHDIPK